MADIGASAAGRRTRGQAQLTQRKAQRAQPRIPLADVAYTALVDAIANQEYPPGAPLSIDGLARELRMSNTPIREALMRANGERLVRQRANYGFIVAELLTPKEVRQLFDMRHLLEVHAVGTATISNATILELKKLVEQMESEGMPDKAYFRLDHDFHRALVVMAGSEFALKGWDDLHAHLHLARLYNSSGGFDRAASIKEHKGIVKALQRGEHDEATALLGKHIRRAEKRVNGVARR